MSAVNMDSLRALEALMNEFFHPSTSNERKREIERILNQFGEQENAWSDSIKYLMHTNNEFASMFCLSVLENTISKKWLVFGASKAELKNCLWKYLVDKQKSMPLYIINKTAKLIVSVGRLDWPHFYPDFFSNIYQLVENKAASSLGLTLLETAIEELSMPREDVTSARKEELHKLMLGQTQQILNVLAAVMENTLDKHINIVTATPPPSPTHSHYLNHSNPFNDGADVITNAFEMSFKRGVLDSVSHMDLDTLRLSSQALRCISHLFAWLPLNQHQQISHSLLAAIFICATFGCTAGESMYKELDVSQLGILAMSCINEIMSKNCVSNDATDFFYHLFQNTFHLMQTLVKENGGRLLIDDLSDDYVAKLTEFLRLFVGNHFPRYECHQSFPTVEFLTLLFQFTFKQSSSERFLSSLEVWNLFLDFITTRKKQRDPNPSADALSKYRATLISLLSEVVCKFQFKVNQMVLEELDDESVDDDCKTEWEKYVSQCIEVIAKTSELLPTETYEVVNGCLEENLKTYLELEYYVSKDAVGACSKLQLCSAGDLQRLHCSLRDLATILKVTGRLAVNFTGEHFTERLVVAKPLVEKLVHTTVYSCRLKFYSLQPPVESLVRDFKEVYCQLFGTLQAFTYWMAQYSNEAKSEASNDFNLLLTTITDQCVGIVCGSTPGTCSSAIVHSALLCLQSITVTVRSQLIFGVESIKVLYSTTCSSVNQDVAGTAQQQMKCLTLPLDTPDEYILCNVVSNIFLLPWANVSDASQEWSVRSHHHSVFIQALVTPLFARTKDVSVASRSNIQLEFQILLKRTLAMLTHLVYNHSESPTRSKQILFASIHNSMEQCITLLPLYLPIPDVGEHLLSFLLSTFDSLQNQIKRDSVEKTVNAMLNLFAESGAAGPLMGSNSNECQLMKEFFKIFSLIAKQPGTAYKSLLPSMLSLTLNQLYPFINHSNIPDVSSAFYTFLYQFLLNNFKFFFKSNLLNNLHSRNVDEPKARETDHEEEFLKVMQVYGQSFLRSDLLVFKENLEALENLNFRFKLYHKHSFRENLLKQFLTLFMQTLVAKSHDLLNDEICNVIYNLASVDFNVFLHNFMPEFLCNSDGLDDNQRTLLASTFLRNFATDLPSFTLNVQKFVNDYRYYRLCNQSL